MRNLNQLPFTVDLRGAPTQTGVVAERSHREDAVSSVLDSSLEGAAALSSHSSDDLQDADTASNRFVPEQQTASTYGRRSEVCATPRRSDPPAASSTLEETAASAWK